MKGNVRLADNDVIMVGPYECIVDISGKVKRPMYYEMKTTESLLTLMRYAGNFASDAYTKSLRVIRKNGSRYSVFNVPEFEISSFHIADGDSVSVDSVIPRYENMKPLDVIPFEYVLYTQERGELVNKSFLSKGDCRREFVESLINDLPDEGSILAYNADGAECLRLKELQREFPEYSDKLEKIISRFVDLAVPFVEGLVYDVRMAGNFSLKKLVAILSDESYENLDINEGMKAVYSWRDIDKEIDTDEEKTIEELKKYCGLDAYGLVIVYRWLREIDM